MPQLSGVYDSFYIQPVARVNENLSIWTGGHYEHFIIAYSEPMAPGPASQVDMCMPTGVAATRTVLAANGTVAKTLIPILQLNEDEFLHLRWEPIDNVVGLIWELSGQQKSASRGIFSQVDRMSRSWDPTLSLTTFFILGRDKDMNLECRNPMGYAISMARFQFYGHRFILTPIDTTQKITQYFDRINYPNPAQYPEAATRSAMRTAQMQELKTKLWIGDRDVVRDVIGATAYLPAEGRQL